jgi:hypothetical protein
VLGVLFLGKLSHVFMCALGVGGGEGEGSALPSYGLVPFEPEQEGRDNFENRNGWHDGCDELGTGDARISGGVLHDVSSPML